MAELKLYSGGYTQDLLDKKQNVLKTDDLSITLTDTPDGTIIRATGSGAGIPVDDEVDPSSSNPVKSSGIANALDAKQDVLTSANAGDNVTITTGEDGKVKINSTGGSTVNVDEEVNVNGTNPVSGRAVYAALHGTMDYNSVGRSAWPKAQGNPWQIVSGTDFKLYFNQFRGKAADPDTQNWNTNEWENPSLEIDTGFYMKHNGFYVVWDNDWKYNGDGTQRDKEVESNNQIWWPYWFAPDLYQSASIHVFNHSAHDIVINWPSATSFNDGETQLIKNGWKFYDKERGLFVNSTDETPKQLIIKPSTTACISLLHTFDDHATIIPLHRVHAILCKEEYVYELDETRNAVK